MSASKKQSQSRKQVSKTDHGDACLHSAQGLSLLLGAPSQVTPTCTMVQVQASRERMQNDASGEAICGVRKTELQTLTVKMNLTWNR